MYPLTAVGNLALAGVGMVFLGIGILGRVFRSRDRDRT